MRDDGAAGVAVVCSAVGPLLFASPALSSSGELRRGGAAEAARGMGTSSREICGSSLTSGCASCETKSCSFVGLETQLISTASSSGRSKGSRPKGGRAGCGRGMTGELEGMKPMTSLLLTFRLSRAKCGRAGGRGGSSLSLPSESAFCLFFLRRLETSSSESLDFQVEWEGPETVGSGATTSEGISWSELDVSLASSRIRAAGLRLDLVLLARGEGDKSPAS